MIESKHTPGPWVLASYTQAGSHHICGTIGNGVPFVANLSPHCEGLPVRIEDARLIAAAPDLLAALEDIASRPLDVPGYSTAAAYRLRVAAMQSVARAAIAKALGDK